MPARRFNLLASLVTALKAVPEDKLADLRDSLDTDPAADIGNDPHRLPGSRELGEGGNQDMDGDNASRMVRQFSDLATQHMKLVADYDEMARRLTALEGMTKALAGFTLDTAKAVGAVDEHVKPDEDKEDEGEKD